MRKIIGLLIAGIGWVIVMLGLLIMPEEFRNEYSSGIIKGLSA